MPVPPAVTAAKSSHWHPMLFCGQSGQPAYLCATCCAGVTLTQCHLSIQILLWSQVVFFGFQHTGSITFAYVMLDGSIQRDLSSLPSGERSIYRRAYQHFLFWWWETKWDVPRLQVASKLRKDKLPVNLAARKINQVYGAGGNIQYKLNSRYHLFMLPWTQAPWYLIDLSLKPPGRTVALYSWQLHPNRGPGFPQDEEHFARPTLTRDWEKLMGLEYQPKDKAWFYTQWY